MNPILFPGADSPPAPLTESAPVPAPTGLETGNPAALASTEAAPPLIQLRPFQWPIFQDCETGILVLHWARQIGKSHVLAAWAVDRLIRHPGRLVVVLSNSRDNGAEFTQKAALIAEQFGHACEAIDDSPDASFANMRFEVRLTRLNQTGRIKVLAANPRTARGFSGDLILDEFAFHENSAAIWEAAEPILSSNAGFLCRIASTGNGKYNMFYRLASASRAFSTTADGEKHAAMWESYLTESGHKVSRVPRSLANVLGVDIFDANTRRPIKPAAARAMAYDKRAYDQNYECAFNDENMTLLTQELIHAAERPDVGVICEQQWSSEALAGLAELSGDLFVGLDVGRSRDLSVITVMERYSSLWLVRAILRMQNMRLPDQQRELIPICRLRQFRCACVDMTGIGTGLVEYCQEVIGHSRIIGINFATTVPLTRHLAAEGRRQERVRITEAMAIQLLSVYEERRIHQPYDPELRDDLRKPERITSPGGKVSISAVRNEAGHADHFWSFALAIEAAGQPGEPLNFMPANDHRAQVLRARRQRFVVG